MEDFPRKREKEIGESEVGEEEIEGSEVGKDFEKVLLDYLVKLEGNGRGKAMGEVVRKVEEFDFSNVQVSLITSVPSQKVRKGMGGRKGWEEEEEEKEKEGYQVKRREVENKVKYGMERLSELVEKWCGELSPLQHSLTAQCSSIGNLTPSWLSSFFHSSLGLKEEIKIREEKKKIFIDLLEEEKREEKQEENQEGEEKQEEEKQEETPKFEIKTLAQLKKENERKKSSEERVKVSEEGKVKVSEEGRVKLVWPSVEFVRNSLFGWTFASSLFFKERNLKPFLKQILYSYQPNSTRPNIQPHLKSYFSSHINSLKLDWFLMTSHNFSKAAWGEWKKEGRRGKRTLSTSNFEIGVFFSSKIVESNSKRRGERLENEEKVKEEKRERIEYFLGSIPKTESFLLSDGSTLTKTFLPIPFLSPTLSHKYWSNQPFFEEQYSDTSFPFLRDGEYPQVDIFGNYYKSQK